MFERYAIYYTAQGAFASRGAAWLGWDVDQGCLTGHPQAAGLDMAGLTAVPRKYGFHGTLKAPFRLAIGMDEAGLRRAVQGVAGQLSAVHLDGLEVAVLGRFLALVPYGEAQLLREFSGEVVRRFDPFRAPSTADEIARRRKANLTPPQDANLQQWGYPHVMDQFRFHMTLTGRLPRPEIPQAQRKAAEHFAPVLPKPFVLDALTLAGQRPDGMFVTLARFPLT